MKVMRVVQRSVLGVSVVLMAACSSMSGSGGDGTATGTADGDVSSSRGIANQTRFASQSEGELYTTRAPHNQIYLFAFDDSRVPQKYMASIQAQARYLRDHSGARVMLAGHTDQRGSREYNVALGERRANSVADILRMAGVPKRQMRVVSYGEERPVALGLDEASYRLNRRTELTYEAK